LASFLKIVAPEKRCKRIPEPTSIFSELPEYSHTFTFMEFDTERSNPSNVVSSGPTALCEGPLPEAPNYTGPVPPLFARFHLGHGQKTMQVIFCHAGRFQLCHIQMFCLLVLN